MKTKWTDCSALQDLAAAQARGDDQDIIIRLRSRFMDTKNMICCALEHEAAAEIESLRQQLETARRLVEHRQDALASCTRADDEKSRVIKQFKADTERYRWLIDNSFDRVGVTQLHVWVHTWEPHSVTGEPTEWKARVIGPAIDRVINKALAATDDLYKSS